MPLHPVAIELLELTGPMAVSSANSTGQPAAADRADGRANNSATSVAVYLDGGPATTGVASTIVDVTAETPRVLRAGAVVDRRAAAGRSRTRSAELAACTIPSLEYALVACVAAAATASCSPRSPAGSRSAGARSPGRAIATSTPSRRPRMGGVALLGGFALAMFVAARLPALRAAFTNGPEMRGCWSPAR